MLRLVLFAILVGPIRLLNVGVRRLAALTHLLQYKAEGLLRGDAEWFDHELDVHYQWPRGHSSRFLERGALSALTIGPADRVLELCSGDGFCTERFYAPRAASVLAIDHNADAVAWARKRHGAANIEYRGGDVVTGLPDGPFDQVVWDAAMHHFARTDVERILDEVKRVLAPGGRLTGSTEADTTDYGYAKTRFEDADDVATLLRTRFAAVHVLSQPEGEHVTNLYFFAADDAAALPFGAA